MRRTAFTLLLALAAAPPAPATTAAGAGPLDPETALREGNRRFREGRLEAAVAAYRGGLGSGRPDPLLAYNLGTALHRLGRLPEALLWYRRAQAAGSTDPWLADNLGRARAELSAVRVGPPAPLAPALLHPWLPRAAAVALAWAGLLAALLAPRRGYRAAGMLLAAALVAWGGAVLVQRLGPRPAVLLSACGSALPAGSEVWVSPEDGGGYRVSGAATRCPAAAVGLLDPVAPSGGR